MTSHAQQPPTVCPAPAGPLHPALHFDPAHQIAAVGVLDTTMRPLLVVRELGQPPRKHDAREWAESGLVYPAPYADPAFAGQWDHQDLERFLRDGAAPGFREMACSVRDALSTYMEFRHPEEASLIACWIVGTYFHRLYATFPHLNLMGEMHTGKSKLLQLVAMMGRNGMHFVAPTPAALFRLVEPLRPTFCLDEIERLGTKARSDIEALLNSAYKAGVTVPRVDGEGERRRVVRYETFTPVALAGIEGLYDVLSDRAITITMQPGTDRAKVNREVDPRDPMWGRIQAMGYRLALTRWPEVVKALTIIRGQQDAPLYGSLSGRPLELFRPLMAIGGLISAGGEPGFLADVLETARRDLASREPLSPETAALFQAIERQLGRADRVTVYPGVLRMSLPGVPSAEDVGRRLQRFFVPGKRTGKGIPYRITREEFEEQAKRYGYEAAPEPTGP